MTDEELFRDILHYGIQKAEAIIEPNTNADIRVRNFIYNGKAYFTVQVNGKPVVVHLVCDVS